MQILRSTTELQNWLNKNPHPAFVPTMGALHEGHLALIETAKGGSAPTLVSIFVNPMQFRPGEDFKTYPRDEDGDLKKLKKVGIDAVYLPGEEDVYPHGRAPEIPELPEVFHELEGELRPDYFLGIARVLRSFFEMIQPSVVVFGQKDYQQSRLVQWLISELQLPIKLIVNQIIRQNDGLALSSRNAYLTEDERKSAPRIFEGLLKTKELFDRGEVSPRRLERFLMEYLQEDPLTSDIDCLEIRDAETLEKIRKIESPAVVLVYVRMETPRLLDNIILEV